METFFFYLIKASVCLVLFYLLYKSLLSRETFFRFNRYVLLSGMVICVLLPLISLHTEEETVLQKPFIEIENKIMSERINENPLVEFSALKTKEVVFEEKNASTQMEKENPFSFSTTSWIAFLYVSGFCINFIFLAVSIAKMTSIIRNGKKIQGRKYSIIITQKKICPFSFGKYMVLSETDYRQNPDEIIRHEEVHTQMKHSCDIVLMEFFILVFWFNPVIWLLKRELQDVHEYEADNGVIQSGIDATKYQLLLIKKAVGVSSYAIANSFNHSKIKNRITMILKKKSTQGARLKTLFFIPLAAVGLHAFAHPEMIRAEESLSKGESTTNLQETQQAAENYFAVTPPPPLMKETKVLLDTVKTKAKDVPPPPPLMKETKVPPRPKTNIEKDSIAEQKFLDQQRLRLEKLAQNGTILKSDTVAGKKIKILYTQTFILNERGDTIETVSPLINEKGEVTKVTKSGNQQVSYVDRDCQLLWLEKIHGKGTRQKNFEF
jgi:hypothetical protein